MAAATSDTARDKSPPAIKASDILKKLEEQRYICPLTGRMLTPETASLDHRTPLAQGGQHTPENIWIVDHQANAAKGTMTIQEFVTLCQDVAQFHSKAV